MLTARALACAVAALGAGLLAGCGGGSGDDRPRPPAAQPFSARSTSPANVPRATPADYRRPIAAYRRHVRRQLGAMLDAVAALRAAAARGDLAGARAAWLRADARYESIGAAYGAFGALDAAINGRPGGLAGGVHSARFTGLHRVELALWARRSTRDAVAPAAALQRDVARLRARAARIHIEPLDYALRAHEVLEDALHLQLSGEASPWSGAALVGLRAELVGTRVVLHTLAPLLARRDTGGHMTVARSALRRLDAAVRAVEGPGGVLPRWDRLGQRERERVAGLTAGAAEQLAYVPELIDPRPARPARSAFGR